MVEKSMTDDQLCGIVYNLVKDAEAYRDERSKERIRAMEYFDGIMKDVPAEDGRSKVVSRDVRAAIKKVVPSVVRTILGNDKIVEYEPMKEGDEAGANQATDFVNYVVFPESGGRAAVEDAISDALKLRNGIIKWWCDKRIHVCYSTHSGLDDMSFAQLVESDEVEVLEHTAREEIVDTPEGQVPITVHDCRIKRMSEERRNKLGAIPLENWLIHPDAIGIEDAPLCGENTRLRRSDLVAMGYDREIVDALPLVGNGDLEQDEEEDTRRRDVFQRDEIQATAMQEIEYYDLLVRVDYDNDGIAELRRIVFAGGLTSKSLLENEPWDEPNYADIVAERRPHQWEGTSVTDDVAEIQKIKTVLLRQTIDNLYWQNNLQPVVQEGAITNPESVTAPQFGLPIRVKTGTDVRTAVNYNVVPMVADKSFAMLEYLDGEVTDRTGISDASSGMAPDALQNMTAKASAMIEQAGIGQTEMMVRTIAEGLKRVFKGLLKLTIQHQDKPRTIRLRNEWVTVDPKTWNADMDATVNTGLGAGTRERDMMMMGLIISLQEKLLDAFGPDNPYVSPDNLYNGIAKQAEAAGLKSPDLYFTKPDAEEVKQKIAASQNQPSPEQIKAQTDIALEEKKGQQRLAETEAKLVADASKEREQRDADLIVKEKELENEITIKAMEIEWEREKQARTEAIERERMDREDARARDQRESDIKRAQASEFVRTIEGMN
ncbi:portal protein [Agrobacterium sp. ST15.13.015]|uniref:portal protein n=1 Tax=Agrobacterium sp. ST15.13.015 TaxID=3017319 RepID=UPI0022BB8DB2|nr:phage portal protein [Agrobacterium sp. ST15.13.015]MCZ7502026.1 phage portal protein [Rhizobium rhizogenes]